MGRREGPGLVYGSLRQLGQSWKWKVGPQRPLAEANMCVPTAVPRIAPISTCCSGPDWAAQGSKPRPTLE